MAWWCELATAAVATSGKTHQALADELLDKFSYATDATLVSRCLSGKVLTIKLAENLSTILRIPPPVIFPASEDEAWAMLGRREVERVRAQVGVLKARVESRHPDPVASSDAGKGPKLERKRRRVDGGR